MTQARLNLPMILHYHQDRRDKLDLECIANDYIKKNEIRISTFSNICLLYTEIRRSRDITTLPLGLVGKTLLFLGNFIG